MQEGIAVISADQLRSIVDESVRGAISRTLPPAIRQAAETPLMTKVELMKLTGWSSRTVEYRKAEGSIPFIRRNRTVLFPRDEIISWLREGYVAPKEVQR